MSFFEGDSSPKPHPRVHLQIESGGDTSGNDNSKLDPEKASHVQQDTPDLDSIDTMPKENTIKSSAVHVGQLNL